MLKSVVSIRKIPNLKSIPFYAVTHLVGNVSSKTLEFDSQEGVVPVRRR